MTSFPRNQSGFVQSLTTRDLFVINMIGVALGFGISAAPNMISAQYPNADLILTLVFTVAFAVFNGLVYGEFATLMPRSGGDYIYTSRALHAFPGFLGSWGFAWSQALGVGIYSFWLITQAIIPSLQTIAQTTGSHPYSDAATWLSSPLATGCASALTIVSVVLISLLGVKFLSRFLSIVMIAAAVGTLTMGYVLWTHDSQAFAITLNKYLASSGTPLKDAADAISLSASRHLTSPYQFSLKDTLLAIPVGYWMLVGFTYSAYLGGEVKTTRHGQVFAILLSLGVAATIYILILFRYYSLLGHDFINASNALQNTPEGVVLGNGSVSFFTSLLANSYWQKLAISISIVLWYYLLLFVMFQACVRHMFCWAFDGLLSDKFTSVNRFGAPQFNLILLGFFAVTFSALFMWGKLGFFNYIILFSICFLLTGVAGIVGSLKSFAGMAEHILDPNELRRRSKIIRIAGLGNTVLFVAVIVTAYFRPSFSGVTAPRHQELGFLLFIYGSGTVLYLLRLKKVGDRFKRLPPE